MATAVTLKESDGSEIYPVTDISLVNNGIHAVDIEATTPVPAVETAMIADGAVTDAKIDWSDAVTSTTVTCSNASVTFNSSYNTITIRKFGRLCVASFSLRFTSDYSFANFGNLDIATFPSGYRPSATTSWETMLARNSSQNASVPHMVFRVDTNGVFRLQNGLSGAALCSVFDGTIVYMT